MPSPPKQKEDSQLPSTSDEVAVKLGRDSTESEKGPSTQVRVSEGVYKVCREDILLT